MSRREKIVLAVVLALFAITHISGVFMLRGAQATPQAPATLTFQGD